MPRWICPDCSAVMKVPANLVGHDRACVTCGVVSSVTDADAAVFTPAPIQTHGMPVSLTTINRIKGEAPGLIRLYRGVALLVTFLVLLASLATYIKLQPDSPIEYAIVLGPPAVMLTWLAFFWLLTDFMSDVYRCRRLLEELAKK